MSRRKTATIVWHKYLVGYMAAREKPCREHVLDFALSVVSETRFGVLDIYLLRQTSRIPSKCNIYVPAGNFRV